MFGTPDLEQAKFEDSAARVRDTGITASMYNGFFFSSMFLLTSIATALVYGWGGVLTVEGVLDIGTVVALTAYLQRLYGPLNQLSSVQIDVMTALVSFDRVFEVLDLEPMIDEKPGAVDVPAGPASIQFDHVDFRYPRADEVSIASLESVAVLDQTPSIRSCSTCRSPPSPAQLVALVGPSGAGKTTISSLVPRLYDVRAGAIRINGVDVRDATTTSIREAIGMVTQDAHLFHDTIRANLQLRATGSDGGRDAATRSRPRRSSHSSTRCPTGSTRWSASGATGSPVARSSASRSPGCCSRRPGSSCSTKRPRTSTRSRRSRCSGRSPTALEGRTSIVIAHRLSTMRHADSILVVDGGRIVEQGTHDELLAAGGLYADLYETQFKRQAVEANGAEADRLEVGAVTTP